MKEKEIKILLEKEGLIWSDFMKFMINQCVSSDELNNSIYASDDVFRFLNENKKQITQSKKDKLISEAFSYLEKHEPNKIKESSVNLTINLIVDFALKQNDKVNEEINRIKTRIAQLEGYESEYLKDCRNESATLVRAKINTFKTVLIRLETLI